MGGKGEDAGYVMQIAVRELRAHGQPDAAREVVDQLVRWRQARLDQEKPTRDQLLGLADALFLDGQWEEAARIYERFSDCQIGQTNSAADSACVGIKWALGEVAARRGNRSEALRISGELSRAPETPFGNIHAARASIAAHLGERDQALDLLRAALASGFMAHFAHTEEGFQPLWDDPEFQELIEPIG
jgi:tetratricopeptide (TPR) repeat protein